MTFDTKEKVDAAIAGFRNLMNYPEWKMMEEVLDVNIELVKTQLEEGIEGETPETINRLRDRLKIYKEIRNTPQIMLNRLTSEEAVLPTGDPYDTVDQIRERKQAEADS